MKYIRNSIISIVTLVMVISISCERDDICPESTPTTPRLIIDLYDAENPENKKSAFNLVVFGEDNENILPGYNSVSSSQLILPLKTDGSPTRYVLHKDFSFNDNGTPDDPSDDIIGGNQDILIINYALKEVYVSRACGYKTVYESVEIVPEADGDNWILSTENLTNNEPIEDESATHFNILH